MSYENAKSYSERAGLGQMQGDFLQILKEHGRRYPFMEPQDYGKLAYQSEFGPEHLVEDERRAKLFLTEEWKSLPKNASPQVTEPVGEGYAVFRYHSASQPARPVCWRIYLF